MAGVCEDFEVEMQAWEAEDDHVHILIAYPPKLALSRLVNSLKGASAYRLRGLDYPEVKKVLWGTSFWSPSYCVVSCGGCSPRHDQGICRDAARPGKIPARPEGARRREGGTHEKEKKEAP